MLFFAHQSQCCGNRQMREYLNSYRLPKADSFDSISWASMKRGCDSVR
jgi:hypothetical protein